MSLTRKDFLRLSVTLGGVSALAACGSEATPATTPAKCTAVAGAISANHGHAIVVPVADLAATGDKTYDIAGTGGHSHTVTLTEAQRKDIAAGKSVTVTSTSAAHTHDVTLTCG